MLFEVLATLTCDNAQGEYYLTDVLAKLNAMGKKVGGVATADSDMIMGINLAANWQKQKTLCVSGF